MPIIDQAEYNRTEAKQGSGGFEQMEPGVFELYIQAIRTSWTNKDGAVSTADDKKCVRVIWDVASGPFEKKYTEAYFVDWEGRPDPDKDFMHSEYLSWKNLAYLKGRFEAIDAANPGFNSFAAFTAIPDTGITPEHFSQFVGKRFWAVLDGELTVNKNGYDTWQLDIGAWITPEQVRTGDFPEPKRVDKRSKSKQGGAAQAQPYGALYNV